MKWGVTSEYVVCVPTREGDPHAYMFRPAKAVDAYCARFPSSLSREKKIQIGTYKLYKYKDGFAFKRYEPIQEEDK